MRRSEMVKKMTEHWLGMFPEEHGEEVLKETEANMDRLLKFMEDNGMHPPNYDESYCECCGVTIEFYWFREYNKK